MQGWKSKLCGVRVLKVRAGKVFAFINLVIVHCSFIMSPYLTRVETDLALLL